MIEKYRSSFFLIKMTIYHIIIIIIMTKKQVTTKKKSIKLFLLHNKFDLHINVFIFLFYLD